MTAASGAGSGASHLRSYAMLALVTLLWAGNAIVARAIHGDVPPFTLAFCRWTGALLFVSPFVGRHLRADRAEIVRHWRIILWLGVIGVGCFNAFLYSGLQTTTAANALLIQAAIPVLVLLLNRLFFGLKARPVEVAGVLVAGLGVLAIIFHADPSALSSLRFGRGDTLVLCSVVAWALYTVSLRLRPAIHPLSLIAMTFLTAIVVLAPFAAWELTRLPVRLTVGSLLGILYVATFPSLIAYTLYNRAVADIGAAAAGQMINLQPLFGALLAVLLLGEPFHTYHLIGAALITAGVALPLIQAVRR